MTTPQILVIDDSATMRKLVQIAFRDTDFTVDFAVSGRDGIEQAQRRSPDVILLDFMLPDMKGIDVCRQLAVVPETANIGVIVMSGKSEIASMFRASSNVVAFLPKPFTPDGITEQVRAALRRGDRSGMRTQRIPMIVDLPHSEERSGLALEGELTSCSVFELVKFLLATNQTGTLAAGDHRIYLRAGSVIASTTLTDEIDLRGQAPDDIVSRAREAQRTTGKPAAVTLVEQGYGQESELILALKQWSQQALAHALDLQIGRFAWEPNALPPYVDMLGRPIPFRAAALEHARVHAGPIAGLQEVYQRKPRFAEAIAGLRLSPPERLVLAAVDGVTPLHDLCERTKLSPRVLLQTVGQLVAVDLLVRADAAPQPTDSAPILTVGLDGEFVAGLRTLLARRPVPIEVVDVAEHGALEEVVARTSPRLILVAVHRASMPRELRALANLRSATIVAVLEFGASETTATTLSLGFDAALYKPVHIAEIERLLSP